MAETVKTQFSIDADALEIVNVRAPERKRGAWISQAIREYDEALTIDETEQECGTLEQLVSMVKRLEQRVIRLDSRLTA